MKNTEERIKRLMEDLQEGGQNCQDLGENIKEASWKEHKGVIISGEEALILGSILDCLLTKLAEIKKEAKEQPPLGMLRVAAMSARIHQIEEALGLPFSEPFRSKDHE